MGRFSLKNLNTTAMAVDSSSGGSYIYGATYGDIYMSTDEGKTWKSIKNNLPSIWKVNCIAIDPENNKTIYLAAFIGLYKSSDGGKNWFKLSKGIENLLGIDVILIDPHDSKLLFIGTYDNGAFISYDGGATWQQISNGFYTSRIFSLSVDPLNNKILYAGTNMGIYKSVNQGKEWKLATLGLPFVLSINSITIDP
ncbi:MAG: WD40/YVTN/BNR-like repeat-containing protein [Caldisericum sp.]|jgi:photosystem II stability/assembly factor-like uncharacterized protein|uniref:WD40/YVTN/BNR-like repeat-containing protein n=1 Tax=Caldisericum sp. TaxID=2499687 RepID=UPI003D0A2026